jgi:hypothetical protein
VLVAEDDDEVATLIEVMLAGDERLRIVGRARDGREALSLDACPAPPGASHATTHKELSPLAGAIGLEPFARQAGGGTVSAPSGTRSHRRS